MATKKSPKSKKAPKAAKKTNARDLSEEDLKSVGGGIEYGGLVKGTQKKPGKMI